MRVLLQRVSHARVLVEDTTVGEIGRGLLVFLGIGNQDDEMKAQRLASKLVRLRIFEDEHGKMNLSLREIGGAVLVVSQFTLYANTQHGLRPSFSNSCEPVRAKELYEHFVEQLRSLEVRVETGEFGARMQVELVNNGPVTIMLEE